MLKYAREHNTMQPPLQTTNGAGVMSVIDCSPGTQRVIPFSGAGFMEIPVRCPVAFPFGSPFAFSHGMFPVVTDELSPAEASKRRKRRVHAAHVCGVCGELATVHQGHCCTDPARFA